MIPVDAEHVSSDLETMVGTGDDLASFPKLELPKTSGSDDF